MTNHQPLLLAEVEIRGLKRAQAALQAARALGQPAVEHRSLLRLEFSRATFLSMFLMAVIPFAITLRCHDQVMDLWQAIMAYWIRTLDMPLAIHRSALGGAFELSMLRGSTLVPDPFTGTLSAAMVISAFLASLWMSDRQLALKYLVRLLCIVQASALAYFLWQPAQFPYDLGGHIHAILGTGYLLLLALPLLLALGYGILDVDWRWQAACPVAILAYFLLMLPHKALVHALVLQNFSALYMPMLYWCFGAFFDVLVFVALYSWLVSLTPARALRQENAP